MIISNQQVLEQARSRGVVLPAVYSILPDEYRSAAFTVSGLFTMDQLQEVFDSLNDALEEGQTFVQWRERARAAVRLPNHRLELIYRNFVQTAFNRGRFEQYVEGQNERPFLLYAALDDGRARPHHAAMNGFVAPVGDSVWNTWAPQNGHGCRCRLVALDEEQAAEFITLDRQAQRRASTRAGRLDALMAGPDDGWAYNSFTERLRPVNSAAATRAYGHFNRRVGQRVPWQPFLAGFLTTLLPSVDL